jgi:hypothetical protein
LVLLKCGIIDKNIELAKVLYHALDCGAAKVGLAHVSGEQECLSAFSLYRITGVFRVVQFLRQKYDRHVCAFAGVEHGDSPANPRVSASNKSDLVLQLVCSFI